MSTKYNMVGKTYGRWYILSQEGSYCTCACSCGNLEQKKVDSYLIRQGESSSCGCLRKENSKKLLTGNKFGCKNKGEAGFNRVVLQYKNNAKRRNLNFTLTNEQCKAIFEEACYYCGSMPEKAAFSSPENMTKEGMEHSKFIYNGIDRLNSDAGYSLENSVSCCSFCNWMKREYEVDIFINKVKKIYEHYIEKQRVRTVESDLRLIIKMLLERCIESDLALCNQGIKSIIQHEKDCKDIQFYVQLLESEGGMKNLPSKYAELALGKFKLLLKVYKEL